MLLFTKFTYLQHSNIVRLLTISRIKYRNRRPINLLLGVMCYMGSRVFGRIFVYCIILVLKYRL